MDTVLLSAILAGVAVFFGLLALFPGTIDRRAGVGAADPSLAVAAGRRCGGALAKARLELSPRTLIALDRGGPLVLGLLGLLLSPLVAAVGVGVGLLLPRAYLDYLVRGEARAADEDAPRILRAMVNRAAAGGTYPDLFTAAAEAARHRWVRSDFEEATARYYAAEKLGDILLGLRGRQASRNLRLVCDALASPSGPSSRRRRRATSWPRWARPPGPTARSRVRLRPRAEACGCRRRSSRSSSRRCSCTSRPSTRSSFGRSRRPPSVSTSSCPRPSCSRSSGSSCPGE